MNTPRPASRRQRDQRAHLVSSARREGIGLPPPPLCAGEVLVEKPIGAGAHRFQHSSLHRLHFSGVALRSVAASPIT
jgi:hypothetical protein